MFRFTIRDVLWWMVMVGLGLALFQTAFRLNYMEPRYQLLQRQLKEAKAENEVLKSQLRRHSQFGTIPAHALPQSKSSYSDKVE